MAFSDILKSLLDRAKSQGIDSQKEFALKHGFSREQMNQFLTGNATPPAKTIWQLLEKEGYALADCIFLPDVHDSLMKKHQTLTRKLHELLELDDPKINAFVRAAIESFHAEAFPKPPRGGRSKQ